jgi:hypothetical protein
MAINVRERKQGIVGRNDSMCNLPIKEKGVAESSVTPCFYDW